MEKKQEADKAALARALQQKKEMEAIRERGEPDPPFISCMPNFRVEAQGVFQYSQSDTTIPSREEANSNNDDFVVTAEDGVEVLRPDQNAKKVMMDLRTGLKSLSAYRITTGKTDDKLQKLLVETNHCMRLASHLEKDDAVKEQQQFFAELKRLAGTNGQAVDLRSAPPYKGEDHDDD